MDKRENLEDVKEKITDTVSDLGEKVGSLLDDGTDKNAKKVKPLVTARVLFITVLDKILLVCLALSFAWLTYGTFSGDVTSTYYDFWGRVGAYIVGLIILLISYFFLNWLYKCAAKTMWCITEKEIYKEEYIPFKRGEISVPLDKVARVSTLDILWIFRLLIIHQYHAFPFFFWTWNNHVFKDKLNELISGEKGKIENDYEDRNILPKGGWRIVGFILAGVAAIIVLLGLINGVGKLFSPVKKIPGVYQYEEKGFTLYKDGTCNIEDLDVEDNIVSCEWEADEENYKEVRVRYEYKYRSYSTYTYHGYISLTFNKKNKTFVYDEDVYKKIRNVK